MTDAHTDGLAVFNDLMPGLLPDGIKSLRDDGFAGELGELSLEHVFGALWTRCGLDRRSRSLVTLGALIALRAGEELKFHFPIAVRDGLTVEELEEVVYHLTGYVGYPAATLACNVGREVLAEPNSAESAHSAH
jgi:4-carboxymuconolactone decarboxylase